MATAGLSALSLGRVGCCEVQCAQRLAAQRQVCQAGKVHTSKVKLGLAIRIPAAEHKAAFCVLST
jgi:hypothetical protein